MGDGFDARYENAQRLFDKLCKLELIPDPVLQRCMGLFGQSALGDADDDQRIKIPSWGKLRGTSIDQARREFVELVFGVAASIERVQSRRLTGRTPPRHL